MKKVYLKILTKLFFYVCFVFLFSSVTNAKINKEAVAKLYASITESPNTWHEGFHTGLSGALSPYQSHRSGAMRDSAFVARTSGSEEKIEWLTSIIPQKYKGDSISFIWACGYGNNLGQEWFELSINDKTVIPFSTSNESSWSILAANGIRLSFTAVINNSNGANLGYMYLTLPINLASSGKAVKISVSGKKADKEIWYRLFAYKDVIKYIINNERKDLYTDIEFINMGDAKVSVIASKKMSDLPVKIYNSNNIIAESRLKENGSISKAELYIPLYMQPGQGGTSVIKLAGKQVENIYWSDINKKRLISFMNEEVVFDKYVFPLGVFPEVKWKNEQLVENEIGTTQFKVSFYDAEFNKVTHADKTGRYGAVVECDTKAGFKIKRYVTLFCSNVEFDDYSINVPVSMNNLKDYGIADDKWEQYCDQPERFSFGALKMFPQFNADAAVFLAGLNNLDSTKNSLNTPRLKDRQWWITLKNKIGSNSIIDNNSVRPEKINSESSVFLDATKVFQQNYSQQKLEKLRSVCLKWAHEGEAPNVTVVVHKGKIIFNEAFNTEPESNKVTINSKMWMASITKLLTGVLIMQYVDKGILDLDKPVGQYLPELKTVANDKLTLRHLLNHTSGLHIAGEWASDWNYSLENQIAHILPNIEIGKEFVYHRVGYALAGKILERITGKSVPFLFKQNIFNPLGMNSAYADNTYGGLYCTASNLAKLGQMLLNKGEYNGYKIFSEKAFYQMLPQKLNIGDRYWGIGTTRMDESGLSKSAFGHGAASGSVFRVDPENDLIIISARNKPGKMHSEFEKQFIESCVDLIK